MKLSFSAFPRILFILITAGSLFTLIRCQESTAGNEVLAQEMKEDFKSPPEDVKPWLYWYWINNHISKEGITKDLEAMARVGIGAALIGNIYLPDVREDGKVQMLSEEWKELTRHAIREGGRLGVDIGLFNSPGWSQSGGPWNTESNSMRYLTSSEVEVQGGRRIELQLTAPTADFEDVSLMAFPTAKVNDLAPGTFTIKTDQNIPDLKYLIDKDTATTVSFTGMKEVELILASENSQTVRSLKITPSRTTFMMDVKLFAEVDGSWREIRSFKFDRRSNMDQLGFDDYPPVVIAFPEVAAKSFRLEFKNINPTLNTPEVGLAGISLSPKAHLEYFVEKQLAKMHQTPLPLDDAYKWANQQEPVGEDLVIDNAAILDISNKLSKDGKLSWLVPAGNWTILRIGMTTTGVKNGPSAPNATGLEVDKINKKALNQHFKGFVGDILESMPEAERKSFKYVVADSYETGSQNWTDEFQSTFKETYGYDPKTYFPVFTGRIVNSVKESNRFLWDLRRLVADKVAYEYVGGLRELCEANGLQMWLENYGHWGFPSEFLMYGGQSNLIGGEFWAEGDLGSIECRAASSAAHIYGKTQVSAESYTAAQQPFMRYPGRLKQRGDWSFTEGINHVVFHVYIHQPYDSIPGVNTWFGTEFNRHNTWFKESKPWIDYQRRSQYLLQQGLYVADIAYFIGEDAPKMTGVMNPKLPAGYSFDYINAEVIKDRITVKDGRITLPDGLSYRILVLPDVETMRPALLEKIRDLVAQGAVIMGNPPKASPSLADFKNADKKVTELAAELWGENFKENNVLVSFKRGKILPYMDLGIALETLGSTPDFKTETEQPVLWIHRTMENKEIYFITNQSDEKIDFDASFRVTGMQPELWDATTGTTRSLAQFAETEKYTDVPLQLEPSESAFIVFSPTSDKPKPKGKLRNYSDPKVLKKIDQKWKVQFTNDKIGTNKGIEMETLTNWATNNIDEIKHYSGTATYTTNFNLEKTPSAKKVFLDIGKANVLASVKLNGENVGGLWTAPWRIDVTKFLKKGENSLEIDVTNLWVNQLIADSSRSAGEKRTWSLLNGYNSKSELQPSGLVGPVKLVTFNEIYGEN